MIVKRVVNEYIDGEADNESPYIINERKRVSNRLTIIDNSPELFVVREKKTDESYAREKIAAISEICPIKTVSWRGRILNSDEFTLRVELIKLSEVSDVKISLYDREKFEALTKYCNLTEGQRFLWTFETYRDELGNEINKNIFKLLPRVYRTTEEQVKIYRNRIDKLFKMLEENGDGSKNS